MWRVACFDIQLSGGRVAWQVKLRKDETSKWAQKNKQHSDKWIFGDRHFNFFDTKVVYILLCNWEGCVINTKLADHLMVFLTTLFTSYWLYPGQHTATHSVTHRCRGRTSPQGSWSWSERAEVQTFCHRLGASDDKRQKLCSWLRSAGHLLFVKDH